MVKRIDECLKAEYGFWTDEVNDGEWEFLEYLATACPDTGRQLTQEECKGSKLVNLFNQINFPENALLSLASRAREMATLTKALVF